MSTHRIWVPEDMVLTDMLIKSEGDRNSPANGEKAGKHLSTSSSLNPQATPKTRDKIGLPLNKSSKFPTSKEVLIIGPPPKKKGGGRGGFQNAKFITVRRLYLVLKWQNKNDFTPYPLENHTKATRRISQIRNIISLTKPEISVTSNPNM